MFSIFYISVFAIPFIAGFNGYSELHKRINSQNVKNAHKINKSLLPEIADIFMILFLSAFVVSYSCGTSG